ncbi:MAG TPA: hypothetical protein VFM23_02870 [Gemmatimonadales bacterium]|nr:hypothetical protein [Gemmatimonadales bacterium]
MSGFAEIAYQAGNPTALVRVVEALEAVSAAIHELANRLQPVAREARHSIFPDASFGFGVDALQPR